MQRRLCFPATAAALAILAMAPLSGSADSLKAGAAGPSKTLRALDPVPSRANEAAPPVRKRAPAALKTAGGQPGPAIGPVVQAPILAHCATGFNKTDENKDVSGALQGFECTTPVITCPLNPVYPNVSLEVQIISNNPEQTAKQIRYICTYYPAIP
jgi:hypothetical protein